MACEDGTEEPLPGLKIPHLGCCPPKSCILLTQQVMVIAVGWTPHDLPRHIADGNFGEDAPIPRWHERYTAFENVDFRNWIGCPPNDPPSETSTVTTTGQVVIDALGQDRIEEEVTGTGGLFGGSVYSETRTATVLTRTWRYPNDDPCVARRGEIGRQITNTLLSPGFLSWGGLDADFQNDAGLFAWNNAQSRPMAGSVTVVNGVVVNRIGPAGPPGPPQFFNFACSMSVGEGASSQAVRSTYGASTMGAEKKMLVKARAEDVTWICPREQLDSRPGATPHEADCEAQRILGHVEILRSVMPSPGAEPPGGWFHKWSPNYVISGGLYVRKAYDVARPGDCCDNAP